jgi:ribulose-5-phosphate 4-epimerase/fuculose-1-phosphate aldolase
MPSIKELKETLAYSCNILAHEGHWDNILGHVSVRIPGQDRVLMKPHSFGFEEIRPQHIIVVDLNGKKVEGKYERHSEVFIHTEIYKARSDVNCVVHSHRLGRASPAASAH